MNREALVIRLFIEALSHDLRTPLAAILGYHELLSDGVYGSLDPALHEPIGRIGSAAKQLEQLIAGVDELSRPPDEPVPLNAHTVEPRGLIEEAVALARQLAVERGATVDSSIQESLPPFETDPERFRWLVGVALAAAVRSSPRAQLHVRAAFSERLLRIEIDGTALPSDTTFPLTAEAFADAAGDDRRSSLRLAIVRRLARQLGGDLEIAASDAGTLLSLEIPSLA